MSEYPQRIEEIFKQFECPYVSIDDDQEIDFESNDNNAEPA